PDEGNGLRAWLRRKGGLPGIVFRRSHRCGNLGPMQLERALPWLVMVGVACSAADDPQNTPSGAGASGGGPATATTGVGGAGGSTFATVGVGGGCATSCSGDLKKVVDCHGVVVETCGQDAACLN